MGGGMLIPLAQNEKVQKDLEIVADQKTKLAALNVRDIYTSLPQDLPPEERGAKMLEAVMKKLGEILLPKQLDRLKQIQLQAEGAMALSNPEVVKALKITTEQQDKMKPISEEGQTKLREARRGLRDLSEAERPAKMAEIQKMTKELGDKLLEVLTSDQRAQLDKMKGEKIDIDFSTLMGPGGRGGRGGPGGPGGPPPGGPGGN
jgi:hypothetical protein